MVSTVQVIQAADTYAAQDYYIKLSSDAPELSNSMSVGVITRKYFIEICLYNIFYKNGKERISLAKPYWKESLNYFK